MTTYGVICLGLSLVDWRTLIGGIPLYSEPAFGIGFALVFVGGLIGAHYFSLATAFDKARKSKQETQKKLDSPPDATLPPRPDSASPKLDGANPAQILTPPKDAPDDVP